MKNTIKTLGISLILLTTTLSANTVFADSIVKDKASDPGESKFYQSALPDADENLFWDTDYEYNNERINASSKDGKTVELKWDDMVKNRDLSKGTRTVNFYLSDPYTDKEKDKVYTHNPKVKTTYIGKTDYSDLRYTITDLTPGRHYIVYMKTEKNGKIVDNYYFKLSTTVTIPYIDLTQTKANQAKIKADLTVSTYNNDDYYYECSYNTCIKPKAVEYYKKTKNGKYKKIGTKAAKKAMIDKNVSLGKTYTYKARAYAILDGKKVYSEYSPDIMSSIKIINLKPKLKISFVDKKNKIVKITSDKYNDIVTCRLENGFVYSTDGKKYKKGDHDQEIKAGNTVYIKVTGSKKIDITFHDPDNWYLLKLDFNKYTSKFTVNNM